MLGLPANPALDTLYPPITKESNIMRDTVPALTSELERRMTKLIQSYEHVTGMRLQNIFTAGEMNASTTVSVTIRVDKRREPEAS